MLSDLISIRTGEGACPTRAFTPTRPGQFPGVILYMDGLGIRPAILAMGRRLADQGFIVLVPDLFYRIGPYEALDAREVFAAGGVRERLRHLFSSTDNRRAAKDTQALLAHLAIRDDVAGTRVGVTGYCMGGGIALTAAATYPERIAAAASFHGGNLATDDGLSPHLLAAQIAARVYVAGAENDDSYPPDMAQRLDDALTAGNVDHRCEIYAGAAHGFTMSDFPVYDEQAAERHWHELIALLRSTL